MFPGSNINLYLVPMADITADGLYIFTEGKKMDCRRMVSFCKHVCTCNTIFHFIHPALICTFSKLRYL